MNSTAAAKWHIRKSVSADAPRITEMLFMLKTLYASTTADTFQAFLPLYLPSVQMALELPHNLVLVACNHDAELIGFISLTIRNVMRVNSPLGSIEEIFVCREYRKCGVGTALWNEAVKMLRKKSISRVEVISSLAHPGQRQFAKSIGMEWYSSIQVLTI